MELKKDKPRYVQVKNYLLDRINKMKPGDNQLEPENLLSSKLAMSRETVRKAMSILIRQGIITRWHGKGNFGHPAVSNLPMRIDINSDFRRLLGNAGYTVTTIRSEPIVSSPSNQMLKRIPEAANEKIMAYTLQFFADDILTVQVNVELLNRHVIKVPESGIYTENITDSLKKYCDVDFAFPIAWQRAAIVPAVAKEFGLSENTPLLIWDEVYHDLHDFTIGYSEAVFNPEIMNISMKLSF